MLENQACHTPEKH